MRIDLTHILLTDVPHWLLLAFYFVNVLVVSLYGVHALWLTAVALWYRKDAPKSPGLSALSEAHGGELPVVTVQLPLFNERWVADRVIRACCAMDWPADKLEIQVLDDSTSDADRRIVDQTIASLESAGHDVKLLRRENREGFKAGALEAATPIARGEYLAIFDADFVPPTDFLQKLMPYFADAKTGMAQGRWEHLNPDQNLLTACQECFIDGHFAIEQIARSRAGRYFNFNGTAGVWRKACIDDAGGWTQRTLTEDLDLSYRAQLAKWKFVYDVTAAAPAELPATMSAFKAQQRRWNKGTMEVCKILLGDVWRSDEPLASKIESTIHLGKPILHFWLVAMALLSFPASVLVLLPMAGKLMQDWTALWILTLVVWVGATVANGLFYLAAAGMLGKRLTRTLILLPAMTAIGVGISLSNAWAVAEALLGRRSGFERTPKAGGVATTDTNRLKAASEQRKGRTRRMMVASELSLSLYLTACVTGAVVFQQCLSGLPYLVLFALGFAWSVVGDRAAEWWARHVSRTIPLARLLPASQDAHGAS